MALGLACVIVTSGTQAISENVLPVVHKLSEVKELSETGWGELTREGDRNYRAVQPGARCWLAVPDWWGGTIRPPEGERYIIEIVYKDTVKSPARVLSHSGIGRYGGPTELHRIGGRGDGKWKIGHIPASWDLLMLPKDQKVAQFHFRIGGDQPEFPIAQLSVREAKLPEDQTRYEAECRAWVAAVQAEKAAAAQHQATNREPVIPEAYRDQTMVPFVRHYSVRIQPNSSPQAGEAGTPIHVRMARNEYEPGTFGVFAQEDLDGVTYEVSELRGPDGKLACEVRRYTAEYALFRKRQGKETVHSWEPQRIWPHFPAKIRKGDSCLFWLTVRTLGEESQPGHYEGTVTVRCGGQSVALPLKVEVLPITLLTMEEAGYRMGGCVTGLASESEMAAMRQHNHNMINIWFAGVQPGMKKVGERIELDFYYLDDFMKRARLNGVNTMVWFFGGNPNGYPETLSAERDLYRAYYPDQPREAFFEKQRTEESRGRILPEVEPLYGQLLKDILAHAGKNDWPELVITPFDEPAKWAYHTPRADKNYKTSIGCGPWIRDHFKAACKLMHEAVPEAKVYVSMHRNFHRKVHGYSGRVGEIFIPDVDIVCTNATGEDSELNKKTWDAGKAFWQYRGLRGGRYTFGFFFARWGSAGSLVWAYNWGPRLDIASGNQWMYAWYSPFETILTPTYEELREAWDDRRYWATAEKVAREKGISLEPVLAQIRGEVQSDRDKGLDQKEPDFWGKGLHGTKMDKWRKVLADKIVEMTK